MMFGIQNRKTAQMLHVPQFTQDNGFALLLIINNEFIKKRLVQGKWCDRRSEQEFRFFLRRNEEIKDDLSIFFLYPYKTACKFRQNKQAQQRGGAGLTVSLYRVICRNISDFLTEFQIEDVLHTSHWRFTNISVSKNTKMPRVSRGDRQQSIHLLWASGRIPRMLFFLLVDVWLPGLVQRESRAVDLGLWSRELWWHVSEPRCLGEEI